MNTADVASEVKCLRSLIGMRCANVYDLSPKTYVFKLMNSSGVTESGESEKVLLLMESGARLHTTAYVRDKSSTPSGFTLKLRRHIRTRRLEDVRQLGYDRIIVFQFGLGTNAHYVILELYSQGNILLTDSDFMVMTLLRSHRDDDKGFAIMSRHHYPVEMCRVFKRTTTEKLHAALISLILSNKNESIEVNDGKTDESHTVKEKQGKEKSGRSSESKSTKDGLRGTKQATLKSVLGEALGYGPALSEHILLDTGLVANTKVTKEYKLDDATVTTLAQAVARFEDWLQDIISGDGVPEGYILMQNKKIPTSQPGNDDQVYDEFCPLLLNQFKSREHVKFETFDAALDEFYSKIESQRAEQQQRAKEGSALQRLNKIRSDQENRVHSLEREVEHSAKMAKLIEYNLEDVDAAILAVRVALANGMSWEELARMVKEEKKSGNPVAGLIDRLYLEKNCMTLLLSNNLDEMDDDERALPVDKVEVDLALSAHANARRWYELKKRQESKQEKTITAHDKAFKAAEKKTRYQLSQEKSVATISHMRKVHWFEKFNWFVSSENYLIISGRDAQQNEMIVKRYMTKGDLYVHADLHGASSTVIKNHKPEHSIPPLTLNQAGCFTVCHSQAWDSKIVTSAWWVYSFQVSKTAPTGEYLTVGSFMIRGKKNFLPPQPLIMGFGMLFRFDESSLGFHLNERRVRGEEDGLNDVEDHSSLKEKSDSESETEITDEISRKQLNCCSDKATVSHKPAFESLCQLHEVTSAEKGLTAFNSNATGSHVFQERDILDGQKSVAPVTFQLDDLIDRALELGSAARPSKSYALEIAPAEMNEENVQDKTNAEMREKPYISKAERRKLKKGQKTSYAQQTVEHQEKVTDNVSGSLPEKSIQTSRAAGGKINRGQRSKLKKMKEKYADQDEEERNIRMALLASAGKVYKTDKETQNGSATAEALKPISDAPKICYKCKRIGHLSRDCPEHADESLPSHTKGGSESISLASDAVSEMDKVVMEEDDINEIGEEEKEKLNDVDYLTGNPLPNDILLYAVPVCAPHTAIQAYKYRVKIVPGSAKRGKAAKTAVNLFSHMADATIREKDLMKACPDAELVAAIIGNVKIAAAGLTQLKQKQKKGKKISRKES